MALAKKFKNIEEASFINLFDEHKNSFAKNVISETKSNTDDDTMSAGHTRVKFATIEAFNAHMATRSYVTGYSLSEDDKAALANLKAFPSSSAQPHAYRWALHISALTGNRYAVECLNCRVEGI